VNVHGRPVIRSLILVLVLGGLALALPGAGEARRARYPAGPFRESTDAIHLLRESFGHIAPREVGETRETFIRMTRDASSFFLGALPVFAHDLADRRYPWNNQMPGPKGLIVGDAHIANLGTVRDGRGTLLFDWVSLDQATPASMQVDVRRWLVSLVLIADEIATWVPDTGAVLREGLHAYRGGLTRFLGNPTASEYAISQEHASPFVRKMLREASHRRRDHLLARWTVVTSRGRIFRTHDEFTPLAVDRTTEMQRALAALGSATRDHGFLKIKHAVVRTFQGRGESGRQRIYLLVEGPSSDLDDDHIFEAHLPVSSAFVAHAPIQIGGPAQATHTFQAAQRLRRSPEPFLGVLRLGGESYVVSEVQPWETRLSTEDVGGLADLFDLARTSGILLARAHSLTVGTPGGMDRFVADWDRRADAWENGMIDFALHYAEQVHADHAAFKAHLNYQSLLRTVSWDHASSRRSSARRRSWPRRRRESRRSASAPDDDRPPAAAPGGRPSPAPPGRR
jgi:uncharacterized protein (DUF2252 family)